MGIDEAERHPTGLHVDARPAVGQGQRARGRGEHRAVHKQALLRIRDGKLTGRQIGAGQDHVPVRQTSIHPVGTEYGRFHVGKINGRGNAIVPAARPAS